MHIDFDVEIDLSGLDQEIQHRLGPMSPAQKFVDSSFIRVTDPYVPFRTGAAKDSAITNSVIGSGKIERVRSAIVAQSLDMTRQQWFRIRKAALGYDVP